MRCRLRKPDEPTFSHDLNPKPDLTTSASRHPQQKLNIEGILLHYTRPQTVARNRCRLSDRIGGEAVYWRHSVWPAAGARSADSASSRADQARTSSSCVGLRRGPDQHACVGCEAQVEAGVDRGSDSLTGDCLLYQAFHVCLR